MFDILRVGISYSDSTTHAQFAHQTLLSSWAIRHITVCTTVSGLAASLPFQPVMLHFSSKDGVTWCYMDIRLYTVVPHILFCLSTAFVCNNKPRLCYASF